MLRDGRADVALMHAPFNSLTGFDSEELMTEGQIAVLPAGHPLAAHGSLSPADVVSVPTAPRSPTSGSAKRCSATCSADTGRSTIPDRPTRDAGVA
ncbi:LysR substrate binding domain-containing protein [Streptomyces sp. BpilaLS-43]|nr:LysR substrate binding domain-containing protein [Streptomyces sp. BpilaLS-43]